MRAAWPFLLCAIACSSGDKEAASAAATRVDAGTDAGATNVVPVTVEPPVQPRAPSRGTLDSTYGTQGTLRTKPTTDGSTNPSYDIPRFFVASYGKTGALDPAFAVSGLAVIEMPHLVIGTPTLVRAPDGRILAGARSADGAVIMAVWP